MSHCPQARPLGEAQAQALREADPLAHEVWTSSDGQTTVAQLALKLDQPEAALWRALDRLADAGLLLARLAPPVSALPCLWAAPMTRREVLGKLAAGVAASVALPAVLPSVSWAQEARVAPSAPAAETTLLSPEEVAVEASHKRVQEAAAKQEASATRVSEARKKHEEAKACQESSRKAKAAEPCDDPKKLKAQLQESERELRAHRHAEEQAKRDHQRLSKRSAQEKELKARERQRHTQEESKKR